MKKQTNKYNYKKCNMLYNDLIQNLLKTGSLDDAVREFSLAAPLYMYHAL